MFLLCLSKSISTEDEESIHEEEGESEDEGSINAEDEEAINAEEGESEDEEAINAEDEEAINAEDEEMAIPPIEDQDLQAPPFAADKSLQQTKQVSPPSNVEGRDSRTPSSTIEHLRQTSLSAIKGVPEQASTAPSMMGLKENKPLSLVREYLLYSLTSWWSTGTLSADFNTRLAKRCSSGTPRNTTHFPRSNINYSRLRNSTSGMIKYSDLCL